MAWTELQETNATTISGLFSYVSGIVPIFWPMILFGFWLIITMGSYFSQKRLSGTGDFWASTAAASYSTLLAAIMLSAIPNVITITTLTIVIGITIVFTGIFILSREKGGV